MVNKSLVDNALGQLPQAQGAVPRGGQGVLGIRAEAHILHEVVVSVQGLLGIAEGLGVASDLPHDQGLVCEAPETWENEPANLRACGCGNWSCTKNPANVPREEETTIELSTSVVAMAVTQLEWPSRTPFMISAFSAICVHEYGVEMPHWIARLSKLTLIDVCIEQSVKDDYLMYIWSRRKVKRHSTRRLAHYTSSHGVL